MAQPHYHPCNLDCPHGLLAGTVASGERQQVLREVYWKLREHASALRSTKVYRNAKAAHEYDRSDERRYQRYAWLESNCRGIEDAARDVADLLGVEEYDIEPLTGDGSALNEQ